MTLQVIIRTLFLVYNGDRTSMLTTEEIFLVFFHGLRMDISMSGYFIMFTALMLMASVFTRRNWYAVTLHVVSVTGIVLTIVVAAIDSELYGHWGFRMDITPLFYVQDAAGEALGSVEAGVIVRVVALMVGMTGAALYVYRRWLASRFNDLAPIRTVHVASWLGVTLLFIIPIRGSFTVAPMNTGFVYFHKNKSFANHAAINVVWNFLYSLNKYEQGYPENFHDKEKAESAISHLYADQDSTVRVFNRPKPNIILFILESFTADVIEPLGGRPGVAPHLNALCDEGMLFTNFYSSGDRTDKGLISILSGYPAQTKTSIIKSPAKSQRLPNLNHFMNALGYTTSFVYGGDPDFANFRSYLTHSNFHHMTTEEDFDDPEATGKWGVHDHLVFERAFVECDTAVAPFFKVILSLSSHEPFDVPMETAFHGADPEQQFLNSCHYTDKHLGAFMEKAKASSWWDNTVVIFVADHGHRLPGNKELKAKERFRIPLLMAGGALKKDSVIHTFGNQTDIANTLLGQLDRVSPEFRFSQNLLSPNAQSFAMYFFNNGYGFVGPDKWVVYDHNANEVVVRDGVTENDLDLSKAYQQVLFSDYNSK